MIRDKTRAGFVALLECLLLGSALVQPATAQTSPITRGVVLEGVTIVDTVSGRLSPSMALAIDDGRIIRIARSGEIAAVAPARLIGANGKFVVPGYLEMHNHPLMSPDPRGSLALMLANGITGFRQMASTPGIVEQRQKGAFAASGAAPELLLLAGPVLTGPGTPEAAISKVRKQKAMGVDFIKLADAAPNTFLAAMAEAKAVGLPFVGHLPPTVSVLEAASGGMRAVEHLGPRDSILLSCSTEEAALRREIAGAPPARPPLSGGPALAAMIQRILANPILATNSDEFLRYQRVVDTFSEAKCRAVAAQIRAAAMWQVPTLSRVRAMEFGDDPEYRADPNLRYVPTVSRQLWDELAVQFTEKISPATRATLRSFFALQLRLVKIFKEERVDMLAGTDGGQWLVPGFSLHREFDLLAEAGLTPLEILQMTTINGARFLGREATMGRIAEGRTADLVLLDADPLVSHRNLARIHAVVRAGAYYDAEALAALKKLVEESATKMVPPPAKGPAAEAK